MRRYRLVMALLGILPIWVAGPARALPPAPSSPAPARMDPAQVEAELRARIKAELLEELRREQGMQDKTRTVESSAKMPGPRPRPQPQPQPSQATPTREATAQPTRPQQAAPGPVPGQRYQIPAEYAGTAPGYVITYAGYNYLVGNDGTMTYYAGQVYQPQAATATQPATTGNTYYTGSVYQPQPAATTMDGYYPQSGSYASSYYPQSGSYASSYYPQSGSYASSYYPQPGYYGGGMSPYATSGGTMWRGRSGIGGLFGGMSGPGVMGSPGFRGMGGFGGGMGGFGGGMGGFGGVGLR